MFNNTRRQIAIIKTLAILIENHIPIPDALLLIQQRHSNKKVRKQIAEIINKLQLGYNFHTACLDATYTFGKLFCQLLAVCDLSGNLCEILKTIEKTMSQQLYWQQKIIRQISYPLIILTVGIAIFSGLLVFIAPQFNKLYGESELPWITQILFSIDSLSVLKALAVLTTIGLISWLSRKPIIRFVDKHIGLNQQYTTIKFAQFIRLLLKAQLTFSETFILLADYMPNYTKQIEKAYTAISQGISLSESLNRLPFLQNIDKQLLIAGEKSGSLVKVLNEIIDINEQHFSHQLEIIMLWLEPALLLLLGVIIGMFALALYLPIFQLGVTVG